MDFKIALRNVKKSFKDYGVYFLTLTLAVCIFYTFNSIGSQQAFSEIQNSKKSYVELLNLLLPYISLFVIVILGSLILYANKFLIRKRNREFGIYMTLGMSKFRISKILIFETVFIGIFSLIVGIILGVIFSQGISILSLSLFDVDMNKYKFVLSLPAILKNIIYFGGMFLLVMILNLRMISKFKIIHLLTSNKRNEKVRFKNPFIHLILFLVGLVSLGVAYLTVLKLGLMSILESSTMLLGVISLGVIGTVLFFLSVSSFLIYMVKRIKRIYFRGLNIFIVKQIGSKINTNFLSMSIICLMFFMTIVSLSSGVAFRNSINSGLEDSTPFDASAYIYVDNEESVTLQESFEKMGFKFSKGDKAVYFNEYSLGTDLSDITGIPSNYDVSYVKESDYNEIRKLKGDYEITLSDDEILMISNMDSVKPLIESYMEENETVNVDGKDYKVKNDNIIEENMITYAFKNNFLTIVIDDKVLEDKGILKARNVNINFHKDNNEAAQMEFMELLDSYLRHDIDHDEVGFVLGITRDMVYSTNTGITTIILFVVIYLGIVFLISGMALLSLQQLTDMNDSVGRYKSLKKLGVSVKGINKTILAQVSTYFSLPVGLAIIHSIVGLKVISDLLQNFNKPNIFIPSLITMSIILIVYALYFYVTYTTYKNIVKNEI